MCWWDWQGYYLSAGETALAQKAEVARRTGEVIPFLKLGYLVLSKWMAKAFHPDEVVSEVEDHAEPNT